MEIKDAPRLSPRQWEIVRRISRGQHAKEIAWQMGITVGTVKGYVALIGQVLNVHGALEICAWYWQHLDRQS